MPSFVTKDPQNLAQHAIDLLDRGDVAGARTVLVGMASSSRYALVSMEPPSEREHLMAGVMSCIVGVDWVGFQSGFVHGPYSASRSALAGASTIAGAWTAGATLRGSGSDALIPLIQWQFDSVGPACPPDITFESSPSDHLAGAESAYADYLTTLKRRLVVDPSDLFDAHECMRNVSSITRDFFVPSDSHDALNVYVKSASYEGALRSLLRAQQASQSVAERAMKRLVWAAKQHGMPQREIAGLIQRPQTQVFRQLKSIDENPGVLALSPREIMDNFKAGRFDRPTLILILAAYPYASGDFPEDEPDWGYLPGSWDELTEMAIEGEISRDELDLILAASRARSAANE